MEELTRKGSELDLRGQQQEADVRGRLRDGEQALDARETAAARLYEEAEHQLGVDRAVVQTEQQQLAQLRQELAKQESSVEQVHRQLDIQREYSDVVLQRCRNELLEAREKEAKHEAEKVASSAKAVLQDTEEMRQLRQELSVARSSVRQAAELHRQELEAVRSESQRGLREWVEQFENKRRPHGRGPWNEQMGILWCRLVSTCRWG